MENREKLQNIGKKIKGIRTCLFVTHGLERGLKARPMGTQDIEFDGSVWFMTDKRSNKYKEIENNKSVALEYADGNGVTFVSLSGDAEFLVDQKKIEDFWNPFYKAWFESPQDQNIVLIKVTVTRAEYWDNKGGKLGGLADIAIGAVTGKTNSLDEHEVYTF